MRVLVFGKTGQVACELARFVRVTNLSRVAADLFDPSACANASRRAARDAVINAAAYTPVVRVEEEEVAATEINGESPTAMAQVCAELDIPFGHFSMTMCSMVKVWFHSSRPTLSVCRILIDEVSLPASMGLPPMEELSAHVLGYFRTSQKFVKRILNLSEAHDNLLFVADQIGGPTAAAGIAKTYMIVAPNLREKGSGIAGVHHLSGAQNVSWAELARTLFTFATRYVNVVDIFTSVYPTLARRPLNFRVDFSQLMQDYGIDRPDWRKNLEDILSELGVLVQDQAMEREPQ